jgi:hypothetical protein
MVEEKLQINKHTQAERDGIDKMLKSKRNQGANKLSEQTTHSGLPVAGYKPQTEANVKLVNTNKQLEEVIMRILDMMKTKATIDQRWLAIGRTAIEQGFMAVNRAVFQPGRVKLDDKALDFLQTVLDDTGDALL